MQKINKKSITAKNWRKKNPDYHKNWRQNNPDYDIKWRETNKDSVKASRDKWAKNNPEKIALKKQRQYKNKKLIKQMNVRLEATRERVEKEKLNNFLDGLIAKKK